MYNLVSVLFCSMLALDIHAADLDHQDLALMQAVVSKKISFKDAQEQLRHKFHPHLSLLKSTNYHLESAALRAKYSPEMDSNLFFDCGASKQRVEEIALLIDAIQKKQNEKNFELALQETMKIVIQAGDDAFTKAFAKDGNFQESSHQLQENNKKVMMLTQASSNPKEFILNNFSDFSFHLIRFGDSELIKFYHNQWPNYFKQKISVAKHQNYPYAKTRKTSTKISPYAFALLTAQGEIKRTIITPTANFRELKERIAITNILNPHKCLYLDELVFNSYKDRAALKNFAFERMKFNKKLLDSKSNQLL